MLLKTVLKNQYLLRYQLHARLIDVVSAVKHISYWNDRFNAVRFNTRHSALHLAWSVAAAGAQDAFPLHCTHVVGYSQVTANKHANVTPLPGRMFAFLFLVSMEYTLYCICVFVHIKHIGHSVEYSYESHDMIRFSVNEMVIWCDASVWLDCTCDSWCRGGVCSGTRNRLETYTPWASSRTRILNKFHQTNRNKVFFFFFKYIMNMPYSILQ